jgi:N-acetylglucosamine kinase-like BadF-type ATPase
MAKYYLGIDIGATKSHALIADERGRAVGFAKGGPGNPDGVGYPVMSRLICDLVEEALAGAGLLRADIAGAGFGIGGYDWPSQRADFLAAIRPAGLSAPFEVVNDAILGLLAGASQGWGIAVVSGTGCNCRGWDRSRREGRVTGMGLSTGEAAGASELVSEAIIRVIKAWSRRAPHTQLTQAFMQVTGASSVDQLVEWLSNDRIELGAEAAPLIFQAAAGGDRVAQDVIRWAGAQLGDMALGVIRQLGFEQLDFEVVQVGSLFNVSPRLGETMLETIQTEAPGARLVKLSAAPVVGGVLLGMEMAGLQPFELRQKLIENCRDLI